ASPCRPPPTENVRSMRLKLPYRKESHPLARSAPFLGRNLCKSLTPQRVTCYSRILNQAGWPETLETKRLDASPCGQQAAHPWHRRCVHRSDRFILVWSCRSL